MKALILSGGKGTRLRPLTHTIAKQLVPIANKPIIHYVVERLTTAGITEIGVVISPETGAEVMGALGNGSTWGARFTFITQEIPGGLAHAVLTAREFLKDDSFIMFLGDNLVGHGVGQFIDEFNESGADALVLLKRVDDATQFGVAVIDETGKITDLEEKPQIPRSDLALVGIYIFSPSIHQAIDGLAPSGRGELEITDAIKKLITIGCTVRSHILDAWWLDTGKKDDLLEANRVILDEMPESAPASSAQISKGALIKGRVSIAENVVIVNSEVRGPVAIGSDTMVENSFIGPFTSIGSNCTIERSSVSHSVILDGAELRDVKHLDESVVGRNSRVLLDDAVHGATRLMIGDDAEVRL